MRLAAARLAAGLLVAGCGTAPMAGQTADDAARRFDEGDYAGAAAAWEELLACSRSGACPPLASAALDYNIGNARFREGRLGLAILHWERALLARPGDADTLANLGLARRMLAGRMAGDGAPNPEDAFARELLAVMEGPAARLSRVPESRLRWGLLVAVFLTGGLLTLRIVGVRRRLLVPALAIGCTGSVVAGGLLAFRMAAPPRAVVVAPAATIRSGPGESFPQLARVPEGFVVDLREAEPAGWVRISAAGVAGFARRESVPPVALPPDPP